MSVEPHWLPIARRYLGVREVPGAPTAPIIARWLAELGAWWRDDETPWCGTFVGAVMHEAHLDIPKAWYRARTWADWGKPTRETLGAVAVFERPGGGHVGFLVGYATGGLAVLGGNQGDAVTIATIRRNRLLAVRWPLGVAAPILPSLPLLSATPTTGNEV